MQVSETAQMQELIIPTPTTPFLPIIPPFKIYGSGGDWGFGGYYGERSRFRRAKTINPFAEFGFKTTKRRTKSKKKRR